MNRVNYRVSYRFQSKMPPKIPIRIGLTKQRPQPDDELVDELDLAPLSESVMEALEDIVSNDASEDLFGEELDRDQDPDYVQPEEADPSRLRGKTSDKQPTLNLVTSATATGSGNGKGRSNAPIWKYFDVSDKKVNGRMEKGAVCKVEVGGIPCGKRIMQNLSSTTGLNQHLERRHPAAFEEWKSIQINLQAEKMATKRTLNERFDDLEGVILLFIREKYRLLPSKKHNTRKVSFITV